MPCYDPRGKESHEDYERLVAETTELVGKLHKRNDILADLLCYVGRKYWNPSDIPTNNIEKKLYKWWEEHRKWDEERGKPWND
jgi:hypothetical protein